MSEFLFKNLLDKQVKEDSECYYFSKFLRQENRWEILCSLKLFTSLLRTEDVLARFATKYVCAEEPLRDLVSDSPIQKALEIDNVVFISL